MGKSVIQKFIENQKNIITGVFKEAKGLNPVLFVLTEQDNENRVCVLPIPNEAFDRGKDFVRFGLIEHFKKMLKNDGHKIICVSWNSEAWQYTGTLKDEEKIKSGNYDDLDKKEVIIMTFDTKKTHKQIIYEIKRKMFVNENGMEEEVDLELEKINEIDENIEGRFHNLFD